MDEGEPIVTLLTSGQQFRVITPPYLSSLGSFTDEGFINGGKGRRVVVDVQHLDVDGDVAALTGVV